MEKNKTKVPSVISHYNGGIEQAFLLLAEEENCISDKDKLILNELKKLPQSRIEIDGEIIDFYSKLKNL